MDDFDNDGLPDIVMSSFDPRTPMAIYKNLGTGKFEDVTEAAGVADQLGGLTCVQTDYNNDGLLDILLMRGAWYTRERAVRPSLLRNLGGMRFDDVTVEAGLQTPMNSLAAQWADYDNDGWLDLIMCGEDQRNRLYRNKRDGKFEEVAVSAGVVGEPDFQGKGVAWIDYNNDRYPDLFFTHLSDTSARFYVNNRDGTFSERTEELGIDGPKAGYSCWSWDYDNDGWLDLYANCYERDMIAGVKSITGEPHDLEHGRLYRNKGGHGFEDMTEKVGLDLVLYCMGSNFGDFDNDGYPDMYLGTGDTDISSLLPNRMLRNIGAEKFVDISSSSGTGHLQKGHGVSCGDWDRDGQVDLLVEMGGAIDGDRFHNILFQNPGTPNRSITLKLEGVQSNRAAIGARIKITTNSDTLPQVYRHVTSGSSFGANPLTQTIGIGDADQVRSLEIYWPTSDTTQVFQDVPVGAFFHIREEDQTLQPQFPDPIPLPPPLPPMTAAK